MNQSKQKDYDERQTQIRSRVYVHMLIIGAVLIIVYALIAGESESGLANPAILFIILMFTFSVGMLEMMARDVFVDRGKRLYITPICWVVLSLTQLVFCVKAYLRGETFFENSRINVNGCTLILFSMFFIVGIIGIVHCAKHKKLERAQEDADDEEST